MNLLPARDPKTTGDVIPMINVAFLLLIFFLVMARLAPPDPLVVEPPVAGGNTGDREAVLFVDADGVLAYRDLRGDPAVLAIAGSGLSVTIVADARLDGPLFAGIISRLSDAGVKDLRLATVTP